MILSYLKKWINMFTHKGVLHTKKGVGPQWEKDKLRGFYIDYTSKLNNKNIDSDGLPYNILSNNQRVKIPITIIQYGLGACEKWFENEEKYLYTIIVNVTKYLVDNQQIDGAWNSFTEIDPDDRRSSMVQAEAAAFLIRAAYILNDSLYMEVAHKAVKQMLLPIEYGGSSFYSNNDIYLYEFVGKPLVLNGWIYSIFGLYDYYLATINEDVYHKLQQTKDTLLKTLYKFDCKYWSYYNNNGALASPFYHDLHITQLNILYQVFGDDGFKFYRDKWTKYSQSFFRRSLALFLKALQKLRTSNKIDIVE